MVDILVLLSRRLSVDVAGGSRSLQPGGTLGSVEEQIKRISIKKAALIKKVGNHPQISAMVKTLIASRSRSIADCGKT